MSSPISECCRACRAERPAAAADHWLARLGLADRATSRLDELSHGNQQRVQLAAALVHSPKLLVLDEPFAGLDPLGIAAMSALLVDLADEGVGIVFSSHQLDLVEDVCQDVVIIDNGRVVLSGEVSALRSQTDRIRIEVSVDGAAWSPDIDQMVPATGNAARFRVSGPDRHSSRGCPCPRRGRR